MNSNFWKKENEGNELTYLNCHCLKPLPGGGAGMARRQRLPVLATLHFVKPQ